MAILGESLPYDPANYQKFEPKFITVALIAS